MFDRLPDAWKSLFQDVVLPFRHYESAAQMISANACRFGWGTSTTQCFGYAAFDRIGNAQILSRVGIAFSGGTAEALGVAKEDWLTEADFQGLRKHVELMLVERDWGKAMVALDVTDQLIYALLYDSLDEAALTSAAGSYSLVAQHLSTWFADQRRWFDALYKAWPTPRSVPQTLPSSPHLPLPPWPRPRPRSPPSPPKRTRSCPLTPAPHSPPRPTRSRPNSPASASP